MKKSLIIVFLTLFLFSMHFAIAQSFNITSPQPNFAYNSIFVSFNLVCQNKSSFYYLANLKDSGRWVQICPRIDYSCSKLLRASEGNNIFIIKAVDKNQNIDIENVTFIVDTKRPEISKTFPNSKSITNGSLFYVKYSENNLRNITLYYGTEGNIKNISRYDCETGKNKQCNFSGMFDLSEFNGREIWYWFSISDDLTATSSKKTKIIVDTEKPVFNEFTNISDAIINGRTRVKFIFEVIENNFKEYKL